MTGSVSTGRWIALLPTTALASLLGAMVGVDMRSWRRTHGLRRGATPGPPPSSGEPIHVRTSPLTLLPGWTGVVSTLTGLAAWSAGPALPGPLGPLLVAGGAVVAVTGFRSRVTSVSLSDEGLAIGYAHRRREAVAWARCQGLVPPRWPAGGWRVAAGPMLMPSDLWGHESVLQTIIARAGLAFDGGRWVTGSAPISRGP